MILRSFTLANFGGMWSFYLTWLLGISSIYCHIDLGVKTCIALDKFSGVFENHTLSMFINILKKNVLWIIFTSGLFHKHTMFTTDDSIGLPCSFLNTLAYFTMAVSYGCKIFMKLTPVPNFIKHFLA
jgi:hypothetical protein